MSTSTVSGTSALYQSINQNAASNQAGTANSADAAASSASGLQNQFLTMLITQLQNQDPLNPMDSDQTTSQMAQISTVSGIQQLNSTMTALSTNMSAGYAYQATALIGHQVLAQGKTISADGTDPTQFSVNVPTGTAAITVNVFDSSGNQVDSFTTPATTEGITSGQQSLSWNGQDSNGNQLPAGSYTLAASLTGSTGNTSTGTTNTFQTVNSVSFGTSGVTLGLAGGAQIPFSQITQVI